ncbi:hypothetical protein B2J77_01320 [Pseudomonas parafulva]|uniref:HicB-like antitoxin of toxin-antitoxin system domain-containing protein n=2 Tax=Pseudomonas parafulva TaxID=157782 RepID=A0ABM6J807_9PSED|nr:hypothetical protein B2J77_01320 [Pseudomonas parafulva]
MFKMKYPVVLHKDEDSDYGVTVPDVPGCFSAGETIDEALSEVQLALEMHFEGLVEDGEPLPQPQNIELHRKDPAYADGIWAFVEFDVTPYYGKSVRFNASLPEGLLKRIDDRVKEDSSYASRSGFLAAAALHELAKNLNEGIDALKTRKTV